MKKRIFCPDCDGVGFHSEHFVNNDGTIVTHTTKCETCNGERYITVPMTNADRIRAMSDEELAAVLCTADFCNYCDYEREDGICLYIETSPDGRLFDGCVKAALKYLKQPAEEDT